MDPKEKIILALDVEHFEEAQRIVMEFKDHVGMFKVGKQLFTHCGPKIVDFIKLKNSKVFLDLKYHDIPNTVSKAAVEAAKHGKHVICEKPLEITLKRIDKMIAARHDEGDKDGPFKCREKVPAAASEDYRCYRINKYGRC